MTNHMQNAIEAGAHWLFADDTPCEENCACALSQTEAENVLNAMLPHIRAQVAQEICDLMPKRVPYTNYQEGKVDGLNLASRIARGPQQ